jgi:hypothetical protein
MKLWIRNILQNIINKIESEEDKTLPEDYFKDIIIELQQLSKWQKKKRKRYWSYIKFMRE